MTATIHETVSGNNCVFRTWRHTGSYRVFNVSDSRHPFSQMVPAEPDNRCFWLEHRMHGASDNGNRLADT